MTTNRLEEAMDVYMRWQASEPQPSPDELLQQHPELDEYLRPIVLPDGDTIQEQPATQDRSRVLGDYKLVRELGRGGMGVVHEAWQTSLGRPVALKILAPHLTHDPATLVRFRREATTAARLQHPGIAQVLEFGTDGDHHFLAMQLVRGVPLETVLKALQERPVSEAAGAHVLHIIEQDIQGGSGSRTPSTDTDSVDSVMTWSGGYVRTIVNIIIQVAETLDYAHSEGVIHRDVKPSNILVQRNGRAVLVDFGLAREEGFSSLTLTGDFAGSPYYVSPEQGARKSSELDRRTDLFSLGITLYESLTLHRPFEGTTPHEIIDRILHAEPTPPNKFHPSLAPDLVAVVLKALEKPLHRRYQTAAAFAQDLRAFLEYKPVTARYPTRWMRFGRWIRREPLKATLSSMVIVAVVLLSYVLISMGATRAGAEALRQHEVTKALVDAWFAAQNVDTEPAKKRFLDALALDPGNPRAVFGYVWNARMTAAESLAFLEQHRVPGRDDEGMDAVRDVYRARLKLREPIPRPKAAELRGATPMVLFVHALRNLPGWGDADSPDRFTRCLDLLESAVYNSKTQQFEHLMMMSYIASRLADKRRTRLCANALQRHWPDHAAAHVSAGVALTFTEPDDAIASFRRAITLDPGFFSAYLNLSLALSSQGELDEAIEHARHAIELQPEHAGIHSICSSALTRQAMTLRGPEAAKDKEALLNEAIEHARVSIAAFPTNGRYQLQLAAALERAGDADQAWKIAQEAIKLEPRYGSGHRSILGLARIRGDLAAQRREHERWIKVNPGGPTAFREFAEFLLAHREGEENLDRAFEAIRRADRLARGRDPFILLTLADVLHARGETATIPMILTRAEKFLPEDDRLRRDVVAHIAELRKR